MGIQSQRIEPHWNYLLALDADLVELSRYIEFHKKNFHCFSIEIARVLLASASEVDVVCKLLCKKINPASSANNIHTYRNEIKVQFPSIPKFKVLLPRFGLTLRPWDEWKKRNGVPFWWTAYNKVKHERDSEFHRASLKNTLNAVSGLFVMVLYLYRERATAGELVPSLQLLRVEAAHHGGINVGGYDTGLSYNLDGR
jgi:hypothetical protein